MYGIVIRDSRIIFEKMINPKCLPLKSLELANTEANGLLTSDTADLLIMNCSRIDTRLLLTKINRLDVEFFDVNSGKGPDSRFVRIFASERRPIGTCWTCRTKDGGQVQTVMNALRSYSGVKFGVRSGQIELTEYSSFKFSFEPSETDSIWIMKFEIVSNY